jgi:hypothetical protein
MKTFMHYCRTDSGTMEIIYVIECFRGELVSVCPATGGGYMVFCRIPEGVDEDRVEEAVVSALGNK